jgi:hypothetical protein
MSEAKLNLTRGPLKSFDAGEVCVCSTLGLAAGIARQALDQQLGLNGRASLKHSAHLCHCAALSRVHEEAVARPTPALANQDGSEPLNRSSRSRTYSGLRNPLSHFLTSKSNLEEARLPRRAEMPPNSLRPRRLHLTWP